MHRKYWTRSTNKVFSVKRSTFSIRKRRIRVQRMFGEAFMTMFRKVRALPRPSIQEEEAFRTFSFQW